MKSFLCSDLFAAVIAYENLLSSSILWVWAFPIFFSVVVAKKSPSISLPFPKRRSSRISIAAEHEPSTVSTMEEKITPRVSLTDSLLVTWFS